MRNQQIAHWAVSWLSLRQDLFGAVVAFVFAVFAAVVVAAVVIVDAVVAAADVVDAVVVAAVAGRGATKTGINDNETTAMSTNFNRLAFA